MKTILAPREPHQPHECPQDPNCPACHHNIPAVWRWCVTSRTWTVNTHTVAYCGTRELTDIAELSFPSDEADVAPWYRQHPKHANVVP